MDILSPMIRQTPAKTLPSFVPRTLSVFSLTKLNVKGSQTGADDLLVKKMERTGDIKGKMLINGNESNH